MDIAEIYAICLGSIFVLLLGWHLAAATITLRHRLLDICRRRIEYTNIFLRRQGSNDFTVATAIYLAILGALNVFACCAYVGESGRSARLASIASLNIIPLYLGGRTSLIGDYVLKLPLPWYTMMHGWVGRICLTEALVHGFIEMKKTDSEMNMRSTLVSEPLPAYHSVG